MIDIRMGKAPAPEPMEFDSRKALAEVVKETKCPACIFALIDGKSQSPRNWLLSRPTDKILGYFGVGGKA